MVNEERQNEKAAEHHDKDDHREYPLRRSEAQSGMPAGSVHARGKPCLHDGDLSIYHGFSLNKCFLVESLWYDGRRHLPADPTCSFDIRIADIDTP